MSGCFGPVVKTGLLTQVLLLSRANTVKDFFISCTVLAVRALGIHQVLGGDTSRKASNRWLKGYSMSYGIMLSMESWGGKEGGERGFAVIEFVFLSRCEAQWISGSPGSGWPHVLEMWWMSFFFCFAFDFFFFLILFNLIKCLYLNTWFFSLLHFGLFI